MPISFLLYIHVIVDYIEYYLNFDILVSSRRYAS
jgi:hypothetical protein